MIKCSCKKIRKMQLYLNVLTVSVAVEDVAVEVGVVCGVVVEVCSSKQAVKR